jgi:hypothetical protein
MGNGAYFNLIRCCKPNEENKNGDIYIPKSGGNNQYSEYSNKKKIKENEARNKMDTKIIQTKSKQSSGSSSIIKTKQVYAGENTSSNINPNVSISNNTNQISNSNTFKNNLIKNNLNNIIPNMNHIDELRHKNSVIIFNKYTSNYSIEIKTKLLLSGDLFSNQKVEIDKYGMKNGLRKKNDGLSIFGLKDNNENQNNSHSDYYFDIEKFEENNEVDVKSSGRVFEIYLSKINRRYTLYFLHPSLILYYKINNAVCLEPEKDYFIIIGEIFLTIQIKRDKDSNENLIIINIELENEKPQKFSYAPGDMPIKIGRVNCNIEIKKPSISKLHSIIEFKDDNYYYKDCGSTNGSTLLIREDDSLIIMGEMSFKLEDVFFKIKEVEDDNYISEEENV